MKPLRHSVKAMPSARSRGPVARGANVLLTSAGRPFGPSGVHSYNLGGKINTLSPLLCLVVERLVSAGKSNDRFRYVSLAAFAWLSFVPIEVALTGQAV